MNQHLIPDDVKWISSDREQNKGFPIETAYFKTVFDLDSLPEGDHGLILHISASSRYCLYVNGTEIINGPCKGDHWHQYCDEIDIRPYLNPGKNIVAAKVTAYPAFEATNSNRSNFGPLWNMSNSAGPMLIVWGELKDEEDRLITELSTGRADWYYRNDDAIRWNLQPRAFWMGCMEEVDGGKIPLGWNKLSEFDGFSKAVTKWDNKVRFGEVPKLFLYDRPIAQLLRIDNNVLKELAHPDGFSFPTGEVTAETVLPANGSYEFILDAGRLTTSFVYLRCSKGKGGKVSLLYSEGYVKKDGDKRYKECRSDMSGELEGLTDVYLPGGRDEEYSPSWFRTFRFIKLNIETGDEDMIVYPLRLTETRYPLVNKVEFTSSVQWLQNVWDISLRTLELCMHETYEDCPFYEQLQYTMDTRLQMLFTYSIDNNTEMPLKTIHDYHSSMLPEGILQSRFPSKLPQIIPVFSLHWIFMLKDYYFETGDLELIRRYRTTMESVLDWYRRKTGSQGLVEKLGYWDFADWTEEWDDIAGTPRAALHGPSTINNLVYACALEVGAFLMGELGYDQAAGFYQAEKAKILDVIGTLCWSEERQLYREGPEFEEYTQHAQLWAVLSGLAEGETAKKLMRAVQNDESLIQCSFVMQYYLFRAFEAAGMYEETEKQWKLWIDLLDLDLTTVPEIPGKKTRSDCHAWGSLLLHELPRRFLGVTPMEPGYRKIMIRPMGLYINDIDGVVPTPRGLVSVRWRMENGKFIIEGSTPVEAEIALPDGSHRTVESGSFSFVTV